ncbi:MAG: Gfo/Idh/MocA family oxidoreductase [Candidatus Bathyarchaeota archaeon]|nr:Gfo/Idh/MocA family oxidoreductase [Candidatus Bathyarchaeota archaeon]
MEKVRLGFVGCGFMGQCAHLPSFKRVEEADIVAIADLRPKLANAVAQRWKIGKVYPSHIEMVEDREIDAVVEITNKFAHASIAVDALKAGKHVFTEKPIATTRKDALMMVQTAEKNDCKLMVGYMKRYDTGVQKAKEAYSGFVEADEVTYARSHLFGGDWVCGPTAEEIIKTDEKYPEVESKFPDFLPKGLIRIMDSLLEQIHDVNLPRYFLGDPVAIESFNLWDTGFISLLNYGEYPLVFEMGSISADFWEEQLLICFRNGWIDLRPPPPLLRNVSTRVHIYRAGQTQRDEYPHGTHSWAFERQAQHFIDCIIEDKEPVSGGADSCKDIVIVESMLKAAIQGKRIEMKF